MLRGSAKEVSRQPDCTRDLHPRPEHDGRFNFRVPQCRLGLHGDWNYGLHLSWTHHLLIPNQNRHHRWDHLIHVSLCPIDIVKIRIRITSDSLSFRLGHVPFRWELGIVPLRDHCHHILHEWLPNTIHRLQRTHGSALQHVPRL